MLSVDQQGIKNGCCPIILLKNEYTYVSSFPQLLPNIYRISQIFVLCGKGAAFYQAFLRRDFQIILKRDFVIIFCLPGESFEKCDELILRINLFV